MRLFAATTGLYDAMGRPLIKFAAVNQQFVSSIDEIEHQFRCEGEIRTGKLTRIVMHEGSYFDVVNPFSVVYDKITTLGNDKNPWK